MKRRGTVSHFTRSRPFVVLQLRRRRETRSVLVRAHLIGDDYEERRGAVLAHAIATAMTSCAIWQRCSDSGPSAAIPATATALEDGSHGSLDADKVLEDLLATASRHPRRLASLEQTLRRLETDPRFAEIVPPTSASSGLPSTPRGRRRSDEADGGRARTPSWTLRHWV